MRFLQKVADQSDVNKMSASNLAIVVGPNLLWPADEQTYVTRAVLWMRLFAPGSEDHMIRACTVSRGKFKIMRRL